MLSVKCAVPDCQNVSGENKTFWPAPKQDAIRKQWFQVLGVPISLKSALICEDHFQVEDKDQGYSDDEGSNSTTGDSNDSTNGTHKRQKRIHHSNHRTKGSTKSNGNHYSASIPSPSDDAETSEEWPCSLPTRSGRSFTDDSDDSQVLVIKSEPEEDDTHVEETHEELISVFDLVDVKIEADPIALDEVLEHPYLEILDQPESSYRFRYKRESHKPHGPLKGQSQLNKSLRSTCGPKVKLFNFGGQEAILRVWLFCGSEPSPHQLVSTLKLPTSKEVLVYEPHQICVYKRNDYTVSFDKLNILHVVCSDLDYQKKYYHKKCFSLSNSFQPPTDMPPFDQAAIKEEIKRKEKDIACLFIEAFEKTPNGYVKLCEVISENIKNKKSPKTNDLKILKQSHEEGSCRGNQQVLIFTEKLIKEIEVEFFEEDEDGEITWSSKATFKESDIHKQVAVCFWTPPYKDLTITSPAPVFFRLVRNTDGATSHNRTYKYLPAEPCGSPSANPALPRKREPTSKTLNSDKSALASFVLEKDGENVVDKMRMVGVKKVIGYHKLGIPGKHPAADVNAQLFTPDHDVPLKKGRYSATLYMPQSS